MVQQPRLKLRDGNTIPQLGLGLWQVDPGLAARVASEGIKAGYRLIDTAEGYNNEEGVGQAIPRGRGTAERALHHVQAAQRRACS